MVSRVAMPLFRQAGNGEAEAQLALGKLYLEGGHGLKRDAETAFYWLNKAALNGNAEASRLIGRGVEAAAPEAGATGHTAAATTEKTTTATADVALADWLLTGHVAPNDELNAVGVLRRAASKGERTAQLRLAMLLLAGNVPEEADEAIVLLKLAARNGSRAAVVRLVEWYWTRSDPAAATWVRQLTDVAEPELLYCLGVTLAAKGLMRDACVLLKRAAGQDYPPAQLYYGLLHSTSLGRKVTGVPHSLKKAAFWLEKASQRGCAQASFELHALFRLRQFSLKNSALADRYLETAGRQGHAQAQFQRGVACLRDNLGRNTDIDAARWLLQAAKQGHWQARTICCLLYGKAKNRANLAVPGDPSPMVRVLARTRIALAARVEIGHLMRMDLPELLLFDPQTDDQGDFIVLDVRPHVRRAQRRIIAVETAEERALLDRARRLLNGRNPHPTDVRGPLRQRRLDLMQTFRLLGVPPVHEPG